MRVEKHCSIGELPDRFRSKAAIDEHGCWLWQAHLTTSGYGGYWHDGQNRVAHKFAWEYFFGPVPDGLQLDHLCRVRRCVNPGHLEPVTCRENLLRGETSAALNAAKTACYRGHEFTERNTHVRRNGLRECRRCMRERQARYRASRHARASGGEA